VTPETLFWDAIIVLISAAAGVGGKIFYDMLRYKAPPREGFDKKKFSEEYDADLCALRHNEIDKDFLGLREEDARTITCLNHVKAKLHGLEIVTTEHHQKLESDDRRILSLDSNLEQLKKDYSEIKGQYSSIQSGINRLLDRNL
jgi:chromosome segregation ATPase